MAYEKLNAVIFLWMFLIFAYRECSTEERFAGRKFSMAYENLSICIRLFFLWMLLKFSHIKSVHTTYINIYCSRKKVSLAESFALLVFWPICESSFLQNMRIIHHVLIKSEQTYTIPYSEKFCKI